MSDKPTSSAVAAARYDFRIFIDGICSQSKLPVNLIEKLTTNLKSAAMPKHVLFGLYSEMVQIKHMVDKPLPEEAQDVEAFLKKNAKEYLEQA